MSCSDLIRWRGGGGSTDSEELCAVGSNHREPADLSSSTEVGHSEPDYPDLLRVKSEPGG